MGTLFWLIYFAVGFFVAWKIVKYAHQDLGDLADDDAWPMYLFYALLLFTIPLIWPVILLLIVLAWITKFFLERT